MAYAALRPKGPALRRLEPDSTQKTQVKIGWSRRKTLVFVVVTCGAFWAAVIFLAMKLFG